MEDDEGKLRKMKEDDCRSKQMKAKEGS